MTVSNYEMAAAAAPVNQLRQTMTVSNYETAAVDYGPNGDKQFGP